MKHTVYTADEVKAKVWLIFTHNLEINLENDKVIGHLQIVHFYQQHGFY